MIVYEWFVIEHLYTLDGSLSKVSQVANGKLRSSSAFHPRSKRPLSSALFQTVVNTFHAAKRKGTTFWTDPQKLDSFIRLPEGIEFGIEPGLIPLVFV